MQTEMMVSVVCLAFNHGKYIRQTLEGFVTQETDFPYEVFVHDDASTDNTADIIREYAQKYPRIIKPILQKENQHSQKVYIPKAFILPRIQGKYVALCEGDDYWTDRHKLQKQVDAMTQNPDCSMCVHKVIEVHEDGTADGVTFPRADVKGGKLLSRTFLEIGKEYSFHTSSYFFRGEEYRSYVSNKPEFVRKCDVGDETYMLYFGNAGNVFYIDDPMSCYRRGVAGSWTVANLTNIHKLASHGHSMIDTLISFDEYSGGKYHDICAERISRQMAITTILEKNAYRFLKRENREYFRCLSVAKRGYILLSILLPGLMRRVYLRRRSMLLEKRGL